MPYMDIKLNQTVRFENLYQVLVICIGSLATLSTGICYAWTSPSIPFLISEKNPYRISIEEASNLTWIPTISAMISCVISSALMDRIGRKYIILWTSMPFIISWMLIYFSNSIYYLYLARVLHGVADGCLFAVLPAYIGEVSTPSVRGSWGNLLTLSIYLGQLFVNIIGGFFDIKLSAFIFATLPVVFIFLFGFMVESPYYLIIKNLNQEAEKNLQKLRRKDNVIDEFEKLKADVSRQISESGNWRDLFKNQANLKALGIGAFARAVQIFAGFPALALYNKHIFNIANNSISSTTSAILFSLFLVLCTAFSSVLLDRLGRRWSVIISSFGCFVCLMLEGVYFYLKDYSEIDISRFNWFPLTGLILYIIFYSLGLAIVPTMMLCELFSPGIKPHGLAIMNIVYNIYLGVVTKIFQVLLSWLGLSAPFTFFCICALFGCISSYFVLPETTGKTLEEIQQTLSKKPRGSES